MWGRLAWAKGTVYLMVCMLAPSGEYSGIICAVVVMLTVANITIATCYHTLYSIGYAITE